MYKGKVKYWKRTHKFGIWMPKDIAEPRRLEKENVNTLSWDLICKEMKEVQIYFEEYNDEVLKLKGFHKIYCQIIFDVNKGKNI